MSTEKTTLKALGAAEARTKGYLPKIVASFSSPAQSLEFKLPQDATTVETVYNGKVRDRYTMEDKVVLVVTNRLSAFDRHLAEIPYKGAVLNLVSQWWFNQTSHIVKNHIIKEGNRSWWELELQKNSTPTLRLQRNANHSQLNLLCADTSRVRRGHHYGRTIARAFDSTVAIRFLMV